MSSFKKIVHSIINKYGYKIVSNNPQRVDDEVYKNIEVNFDHPSFINLGAGGFYHPMWHNVDYLNEYYEERLNSNVHIQHDFSKITKLPLDDDSLIAVYTSHLIEHLNNHQVQFIFNEVHRIMSKGGIFRITCPDVDLEYDACMEQDINFWKWPNAYGHFIEEPELCLIDHIATVLTKYHPLDNQKITTNEILNALKNKNKEIFFDEIISKIPEYDRSNFYGDHINWFNFDKLKKMLNQSGFSIIYRSSYLQSKSIFMREPLLFDSTCPELSIYIECIKS